MDLGFEKGTLLVDLILKIELFLGIVLEAYFIWLLFIILLFKFKLFEAFIFLFFIKGPTLEKLELDKLNILSNLIAFFDKEKDFIFFCFKLGIRLLFKKYLLFYFSLLLLLFKIFCGKKGFFGMNVGN